MSKSIHTVTKGSNITCPLCNGPIYSLYNTDARIRRENYHYWCDSCGHGWYISDLKNIATHNLEYTASQGKSGKSPQEIRELILRQDRRVK